MTFYILTEIQTIMDKSLGTNCHLWLFFTRAKQIHLHLFSPSPSPTLQCWTCVHAISPEFRHCIGGWRGEQRILKPITMLFSNSAFKTPKINAITQVSQGILSTIVARGSTSKTNFHIIVLQKRVVRTVNESYYNAHTELIFKNLTRLNLKTFI